MDLSEDSGMFHTTDGGPSFEQELSSSSFPSQTESGGTITLQLLEFKTLLHDAVEELQIQRDSKTLFEDQISKLVLEKQELEWEKESLQRQTETAANQHNDALMNMQMQFQTKIRNLEELKGKHQLAAELKDKEMSNLKEELKSLQLLKYRLEKKATELVMKEQKLALQCRSKDSHLNQLGEVEKRFRALVRQCNAVKQAHEKLEQNVDDAMKMNKKLASANRRHISTTESLQKELEEAAEKLTKANMVTFRHEKTENLTTTKQRIQQLHLKLNRETEMNKKLQEDNLAVRAEKQEVMRSLQHTQQLLLNLTQALKKVEMELQTQKEQNQALKQEHDMMQEKNKAMENTVAQLMESSIVSKTSWDKEKRGSSHSLSYYNQLSHILMKEITGIETLDEAISSPDLPTLQHSESDLLEAKQGATGTIEGQDTANHQQQFLMKQHPIPSNSFTCQPANHNLVPLSSSHGAAGSLSEEDALKLCIKSESISGAVSDLLHTDVSVPDDGLGISKTVSVSCSGQKSVDKSLGRDVAMIEQNERLNNVVKEGDTNKEEHNREQQWKETTEMKEGGTAGQKRGPIINQTDKADGQERSQQSAEDTEGSRQSKRSRGEGEDGTNESDNTENALEKQTGASYQTSEESNLQQKTDFIHPEPPQADSMPPDGFKSPSKNDYEKDVNNIHQCVNHSQTSVTQEAQLSSHDEVQSLAEDALLSTKEESRASLSTGLFTVTPSRPPAPLLDGAPTLTAGLSSEAQRGPSSSSVSTDQPSFRAQISKIEQFLNADRLHLHKRQRTDN